MDERIKIAHEMVRIAKSLVAEWRVRRNDLGKVFTQYRQYRTDAGSKLEAYICLHTSKRTGRDTWVYVVFTAKSTYQIKYGVYDSEQECEHELKQYLNEMAKLAEEERKRKESFQNPYSVGDILYSEWGYDQTNVDFYKVLKVTGQTVTLVELETVIRGTRGTDDIVVPGNPKGSSFQRKVKPSGYVSISSYESASKWDGRPKEQTNILYGH